MISFEKELRSREKRLRRWLSRNDFYVAVFLKEELELVNGDYLYYGGAQTSGEYAAILVDSSGEKSAIAHEYSFERVKASGNYSHVYEIRQSAGELFGLLRRSILPRYRKNKVAFDFGTLSASSLHLLEDVGISATKNQLKEFVSSERSIKSEYELKEMVRAIEISKKAFEKTIDTLKVGATIAEITNRLYTSMIDEGGISSSFEIDIRLRRDMEETEDVARIERGDLVLFDFGTRLHSAYLSDVGRTIPFGKPGEKTKDFMGKVLAVKKEGLKEIRSGVSGNDVRRGIDQIIREHGFESTHRPGHQIGLNVHEPYVPHLNLGEENSARLSKGNVVTWEPGIGFGGSNLPKNRFGMAHMEDMVHVGSSRSEVLGKFDMQYW